MILKGKKIILRLLALREVPLCWKWINDAKVTRYMNPHVFPKTYKGEVAWFHRMKKKKNEELFAIFDKKTRSPIGNMGLHGIDLQNRKASVGIMIGEKQYWGKGYGADAMQTLLSYCFKKLKLNKVTLTVMVKNKRGIGCYKKCGFKKVGLLKDDILIKGRFSHSYLMEAFAK